ncbi:MAG: alanine racemase [Bacteroidota bacterium]
MKNTSNQDKSNNASPEKTNRTTLKVSTKALTHNLNHFRSFLKPETKIMVMVKAFSYGSGNYEIAKWLQQMDVDYLGVAVTDEGVELRKAGINLPIMVMNPSFESFHDLINYKIEPEIYSFSSLQDFCQFLEHQNVNKHSIHLKLDTGMKRLGFVKEDIDKLIKMLPKLKRVKVKSVFSHLAGSDEQIHDNFTNQQISNFENITQQIQNALPYNFMRHIVNSSGIERFQNAHFDMVRLGIGLYGISPTHQNKLQHISTLKTNISQIKTVKSNETVGYSRKGKTLQDTRIAILPIGYADGFNRKFSNGVGEVLINGKLAPIIGNICMDICMVDLAGIKANEGDEAIIFGEHNPISKLAKQIGTIPYEILTSVARRVKRVYL